MGDQKRKEKNTIFDFKDFLKERFKNESYGILKKNNDMDGVFYLSLLFKSSQCGNQKKV